MRDKLRLFARIGPALLLALLVGLTGCFSPQATQTPPPPTATTAILLPSLTLPPSLEPPTATLPAPATVVLTDTPPPVTIIMGASATPDITPAPTATSAPTAASEPAGQTVLIYLIALEDGGLSGPAVGCGDSAVGVKVTIPPTRGVLRAALNELLAVREAYYGQSGLYNALYQSDLTLDNVVIDEGVARIDLSGSLLLAGVCDNPRVAAQLEQTALQFSTVTAVEIFLNGEPLADALSLEG